jgi:hypothetical protein
LSPTAVWCIQLLCNKLIVAVVITDGYDATVCATNIASYTLSECAIYETFCRAPVYSKETY